MHRYYEEEGSEGEYLFVDKLGKPLEKRYVQKHIQDTRDFCGLGKHVTIHALRRTAATRLRQKETETNTIRNVLNHSDEKATRNYIGGDEDDMRKAMEGLNMSEFFPDSSK
ncbi:MAG: site-specific integrase [Bacteroidota bacterium]|jgi:integrase